MNNWMVWAGEGGWSATSSEGDGCHYYFFTTSIGGR
jgi:hypothetical protein